MEAFSSKNKTSDHHSEQHYGYMVNTLQGLTYILITISYNLIIIILTHTFKIYI